MTAEASRADAIVARARAWIGTPYRHQASCRGAGTDCLGLLRGLWREVIGPEPEAVPSYTADWSEPGRSEDLLAAAGAEPRSGRPGRGGGRATCWSSGCGTAVSPSMSASWRGRRAAMRR